MQKVKVKKPKTRKYKVRRQDVNSISFDLRVEYAEYMREIKKAYKINHRQFFEFLIEKEINNDTRSIKEIFKEKMKI